MLEVDTSGRPPNPVAVIGGGPAGLIAADLLSARGHAVTLFDRMPSLGRKFLLAGRGGLNLTHSEPLDAFIGRYGDAAPALASCIRAFTPEALCHWSTALGEPTFIGTSGRVFPRSFKTSPLLRALLGRLSARGVTMRLRHRWTGWADDGALLFDTPEGGRTAPAPAATVLALGGASWPRLGSDGSWAAVLGQAGVMVSPLRPANCGFTVAWSDVFRARFAGQPLKRVWLSHEGLSTTGDVVVTTSGIEGGPVYALSAAVRRSIEREGSAGLTVDLRPAISETLLAERLSRPRGKATATNFVRKAAGLEPVALGLLREAGGSTLSRPPAELARLIKALPLTLLAPFPLERAISTAGGVRFDSLDADLMLTGRPGVFVAGEMLDWDAPTGGYLLQAAFSTGMKAATGASAWAEARAAASTDALARVA